MAFHLKRQNKENNKFIITLGWKGKIAFHISSKIGKNENKKSYFNRLNYVTLEQTEKKKNIYDKILKERPDT